jgi:chromosome segregation ATPase
MVIMNQLDHGTLNSFASEASTVSQSNNSILNQLLQEILSLKNEVSALQEERDQDRAEIEALRASIAAQKDRILDLEIQQGKDFDELANKINEHSESINKCWQARKDAPAPKGDKTIARIESLKSIMKAKGGSISFGEAEKLLKIHPNQMTALVEKLDRRSFEVFTRSGDKRQRVLRLKAQIVNTVNLSHER